MSNLKKIYAQFILLAIVLTTEAVTARGSSTMEFITKNKYPAEEHKVPTDDGYVLTVYRIPHAAGEQEAHQRPAVLLQHGFGLTSDAWVIPDAKLGLAYQLADAGYDVWLANQRGNRHSLEHATLTAAERPFWDFSFHEIGHYDAAATLDHILRTTGETSVHFVGYSQGTSALFVLLSTRPEYEQRISTIHLLAPVVHMQRMKSYFMKLMGALLDVGMSVSRYLGYRKILDASSYPFYSYFCNWICHSDSPVQYLCQKMYEMVGGLGTTNLDVSLLSDICLTHPAGASSKQLLHFLQVYKTGRFRQFDYGDPTLNQQHYQQPEPPHYDLGNISKCINLYYSHNDYLSDAQDVLELGKVLSCAHFHSLPYDDWNHYDFLWATNVPEALNQGIIQRMDDYEQLIDRK